MSAVRYARELACRWFGHKWVVVMTADNQPLGYHQCDRCKAAERL